MAEVVRSGSLTSAQLRMWLRSYWREQGELFAGWSRLWDLPVGISVEAATAALTTMVERHEILRTMFIVGPDGLPMQIVFDAAGVRLPLSVVEADAVSEFQHFDKRALLVGTTLRRLFWSVRFFVQDGEVRQFGLIFDHIISDGAGLYNWRTQFVDLCLGRPAPLPTTQPLDRQAAELRVTAANEGKRDSKPHPLALAPQVAAPGVARRPADPRYLTSTGRYGGLLPTIDEVCRQSGASRSMVLMYAIGWLLKRHSSHPGTLFSTYVANRSARDRGIECQMRLVDMLLTVDDTETFAEALGSLRALTLRAYEDSIRVGPPGADERARQAADRGVGAIVPVYFNFQGPPQPVGEAKDEPAGPVTVSRTDLWESAGRPWGSVVWLYLLDDGDLVLDLDVDTMMLPESVVHTMIDVLPPLLRTMAGQVHAPVGAAAVDLPPEFAAVTRCKLIAGNWVDPETVTEILRSAPGVVTAAVADEAGEFVAQLRLAPEASWFDVHEWVLAALHHHLNAAAPTLYRIISTEEATPPIEIRPRTDAPVHPPVTMAERELAEAFRETHGFPADDLTKSYLAAGGTLLRVPALVETLRRRGYEGLRSGHFTSPGTLRSVAQALVIPPEPVTDGASY